MKPPVALVSLGCAKNLVDSEVMLGLLEQAGYPIVEDIAEAQVAIVNTCAFIQPAVDEAIEALLDISKLKEQGDLKALICAGCLPQRYQDDLQEELPEVDVFVTSGGVDQIAEAVKLSLRGKREIIRPSLDYLYDAETPRWRSTPQWLAYLKIAEGCDHRCAFCMVPDLRGRYRSREIEDISTEVGNLVNEGVREIAFVAQDTTNYGKDLDPPTSLSTLLENITLRDYDGWIRIMYMYPNRVTNSLIENMAQSISVVPYFDIPFQHAAPELLKRMGRSGGAGAYINKIEAVRSIIPDAAFRTNFIVGLPGETQDDFELLMDFAREARFDHAGVFVYWPEQGTPAEQMDDQVPREVARRRQEQLVELQDQISLENNQHFVGQIMRVLIERHPEDDLWVGRSYRDAPEIDGEVILRAKDEGSQLTPGEFAWATIEKAQVHDLEATVEA